jgi:putative ABC transport system permease protein
VDTLIQDIKFGLRTFIRQPGFALTAALAIALGIGANTAVFSVVYAVLLKPLPYPNPEQLVYINDTYPAVRNASVSLRKYFELRDKNRTLAALGAGSPSRLTLTGTGDPEEVVGYQMSATLFRALQVRPVLGRFFTDEEDRPNGPRVIVLSEGLWRRRFGGDPQVVNSPLAVNGEPHVVVGIMPNDSSYPARTEAWVPLALSLDSAPPGNFLRLVGRTRPGISLEQAKVDLQALTAAYNRQYGIARDTAVSSLQEPGRSARRKQLLILQAAVAFVLLIACANVANLLLARSVSRERELAVRTAIGAGRLRIVRQLLTESLLLSLVGGVLGVLLAGWLIRLFVSLAPPTFPRLALLGIDTGVLAFTLALATVTGLLFGLTPILRGMDTNPNDALREGARSGMSPRARVSTRVLVVSEVALALVLAVGAGLMVKSLLRLQGETTGFNPQGLLSFEVSLRGTKYQDSTLGGDGNQTSTKVAEFLRRAVETVRAIPGVRAAGAINMLPLVTFGFNGGFRIDGQPPFPDDGRAPIVEFRMVTPGYFEAAGVPLKAGRLFTDRDTAASPPMVIINETMAKRFWANASPVGSSVWLAIDDRETLREIVGIVGDVRSARLDLPPVPETFVPHQQAPVGGMGILVRTVRGDPHAVVPAIRERIAALDPDLPLTRVRTMEDVVYESTGDTKLSSTLTAIFALLAAVLASLGVYSVISYSVAQRTRELGVRVALGADGRRVAGLVVKEGLLLAGAGIALGIAGALVLTRSLETLLYEVSPTDPLVLAGTCLGVLLVAFVACYLPARRAMKVDPMVALRAE